MEENMLKQHKKPSSTENDDNLTTHRNHVRPEPEPKEHEKEIMTNGRDLYEAKWLPSVIVMLPSSNDLLKGKKTGSKALRLEHHRSCYDKGQVRAQRPLED